jgi:hypothetical protein
MSDPTLPAEPPRPAEHIPAVTDRLLASSTRFAQSAIDAYVDEDWEVTYLHLSTAVEQLVKAALAAVHPVLIADRNAEFDTLLHLIGHHELANTPESAARTVSVTEAIKRIAQVLPGFRFPSARVRFLLDVRNGVVHAGHTVRAEHEAVLGEVATFVGDLLRSQHVDVATYWGDHADLVEEHRRRRLNALEGAYQRKVRAAREGHLSSFDRLIPGEQQAYLEAREPHDLATDYNEARADCPACGHLGLLSGEPEPEWEADWDTEGGEAYVAGGYVSSIRLYATAFDCDVCSLSLTAEQLPFANLASVELTEEDADLDSATEYFTRQLAEDASYDY